MEQDMTVGSPAKIIFFFTLPMLLGNLFQQLYNVVDTIVVGNYVGASALAAVGASTSLTFLIICLEVGVSMGCAVIVGQYFGAGQLDKMRQAVYVSLVFSVIVAVVTTLVGFFGAEPLLKLIKTPADIFADSKLYFQIFSIGSIATFIYNTLSALCRALGDSKTPLLFLVMASVINIILDLYFVINLQMGVAGVAIATVIAQTLATIACGIYVYRRVPVMRLHRKDCVFSLSMLKILVQYAIPSTIQQSIVSLSQVAVQGLVNSFGTATIAGYTAACKIDMFAIQPLLSLGMAITSYTAQNVGANKIDRVQKGFHASLIIVLIMCTVIIGCIWLFGSDMIGWFVDDNVDPVVMETGLTYIRIVGVFYIIAGVLFCCQNILRGAGDVGWFTTSTLINFAVRIIMAFLMAPTMGFAALAYSIPMGWGVGLIMSYIRYRQGGWKYKGAVGQSVS